MLSHSNQRHFQQTFPASRRALGGWAAIACIAVFVPGCPDPDAEFDSFEARYEKINGEGPGATTTGAGPCDYKPLEGEYLFALSAKLSPSNPVMFRTKLTVDGSAFTMEFQPLKAKDKTTAVGEPFSVGPVEASADGGAFTADLGMLTISGEANPITAGTEIVATVMLQGALCSGIPDVLCGGVTGMVSKPAMLDLMGSTFGMVKIVDGVLPEKTTINCEGTMGSF